MEKPPLQKGGFCGIMGLKFLALPLGELAKIADF